MDLTLGIEVMGPGLRPPAPSLPIRRMMTSEMSSTEIVSKAPDIPSKWDIIPIHASDVSAYKRCRRYWDWTSPARNNLRRRVDISGVKMELWFGTGIHYALEMYYNPVLQRDPVEAFTTWYELQWKGGIVDEDFLSRTYDVNPVIVKSDPVYSPDGQPPDKYDSSYKIAGLRDLLPNVELVEEEFENHRILGIEMLKFYREWAPKNDDFIVVAAESNFSIPLGFPAVDIREDSPNYGKLLEVHARGRRDTVIYYPEQDKYGIIDHKTAAVIGEDYFLKLDKDEQCTTYLWATIMESQLDNTLPWYGKMVDRVLYTGLRKNYPKPPTPTYKETRLSVDRQNEATTAEMFQEAIAASPVLSKWFLDSESAQNYYEYLCEMGDSLFVQRDLVTRNASEIKNAGTHMRMIAEEMVNPDVNIYPNPTGNWLCLRCAFRSPCIAKDDGSDYVGMLADGYEVNRDR